MMDVLDFEPDVGAEDAIESLLDPMDLLDGIELGEFDFSAAGLEQGLENSDSDSGISVSCENILLGRPYDPTTHASAAPKVSSTAPDLVLTDAVYSSFPASSTGEQNAGSRIPSTRTSTTTGGLQAKPVRIFKLSCSNSSGRPALITSTKPIPSTAIYRPSVTQSTTLSNPQQTVNSHLINLTNSVIVQPKCGESRHVGPSSVSSKDSTNTYVRLMKQDPEVPLAGELSPTISQPGLGSILDDYDPSVYSDLALEEHLRDFYGHASSTAVTPTLNSHGVGFTLGSANSPYLPSPELLTSGDCLLTHASLERLRKKQERMIKNRHAASMSRLRKKEYLERLEMRYEQLKRENVNLWRQNEEWRIRCSELERNLTELQSQVDRHGYGDTQPDDSSHALKSTMQPTLIRKTAVAPFSNSTAPVAVPSLVQTTVSPPPRSSLATLSIPTQRSTVPTSLRLVNDLDSVRSLGPEKHPNNRKTVANSVFYSGRTHFPSKSDGPLPAKLHRPNVLTGVLSRHSVGNRLQISRTKIVATTSLLSIFCLFSLNIILSPVAWRTGGSGIFEGNMQYGYLKSTPGNAFGQRVLLGLPEAMVTPEFVDIAQNQDAEVTQNGSRCKPLEGVRADIARIWQLWIEQNKMHQTNRSRDQVHWSSGRLKYSAQPWRGKPYALSGRKDVDNASTNHSVPIKLDKVGLLDGFRLPARRSSAISQNASNSSRDAVAAEKKRPRLRRPSTEHGSSKIVSQRGLQPFYRQFVWHQEDLLEAAGRRNDTVYFILSKIDAIRVLDPVGGSPTRKLTLIVPAYPTQNVSHFIIPNNESDPSLIMLQVDCELRNVSFIHPPVGSNGAPQN